MRLHKKSLGVLAGFATLVAVLATTNAQAQQTPHAQSDGASPAVGSARQAVSAHPDRFGFGPFQKLQAVDVIRDRVGSSIRFDRTYHGLRVVGGDFVVHLTPSGHFRYANGLRVAGLPASVKPAVSAATAARSARAGVHYQVKHTSTALVIFARANGSSLAWEVKTDGLRGMDGDVTYVSATSGRPLASWPTVETSSDRGTGKTEYSGTVRLNDVKKGSTYKLQDNKRGKQQIYNANHSWTRGVGTLFTDSDNVWGDHTETDVSTAAADAAYSLAETWDFYLDTFGRKGIADDGVAARGYVHFGQAWLNASWSDGCFCMSFGDGSGSAGQVTSLDVGGHEMTHGVTSRTARLNYSGESGGLNESTSDVFGTMVEWYSDTKTDVPDYVIGEMIFKTYDPAHNYVRRMDDPHMDGLSADCWSSTVGQLDVHFSSGVGNHLFYLLSEGSGAKTINGIAYNSPTCNGKAVKGIGHDKAGAIWYKALTENWTSTTNYHDARLGMLQAAKDLYGQDSVEYKRVNKAWAAVNVTP